jgi:hypothetical protein
MTSTKKIIQEIDRELIIKNKNYLTLAIANQLLVKKGIFTSTEISEDKLKNLLETNKIPHAYKTTVAPKQWHIPLSTDGLLKMQKISDAKEIKRSDRNEHIAKVEKSSNERKFIESYTIICPCCSKSILIDNFRKDEEFHLCNNCHQNIWNPLKTKPKVYDPKYSNSLYSYNLENKYKCPSCSHFLLFSNKQKNENNFKCLVCNAITANPLSDTSKSVVSNIKEYEKPKSTISDIKKYKEQKSVILPQKNQNELTSFEGNLIIDFLKRHIVGTILVILIIIILSQGECSDESDIDRYNRQIKESYIRKKQKEEDQAFRDMYKRAKEIEAESERK